MVGGENRQLRPPQRFASVPIPEPPWEPAWDAPPHGPGFVVTRLTTLTVSACVRRGIEILTGAGIESPRADAEWLLAWCLGVRRMQLYLELDRELNEAQQARFESLLHRRAAREPLQHLLGSAEFYGRSFEVNRSVLIPRPETELLAELSVRHLKKRFGADQCSSPPTNHLERPLKALDYGTGSGCLAITLALEMPPEMVVEISALDISPDALEVARRNSRRHGCEQAVRFLEGNGFAALGSTSLGAGGFDLIVANPPYIPTGEIEGLEPEVRDHDPVLALDGGSDGLDFFRHLASHAPVRLLSGGVLMAEFGDGQFESIAALFRSESWIVDEPAKDDTGRPRFLIARPAAS